MRKLTLSLAILAAMMPGRGYSLGLGEIELNSALNQELDAEIEVLSAQPEDADQLIIKLGSREAFTRAGVERPYLLQQLEFKVIQKDGHPIIKVITKKPVREPFLNFLMEIDWPQGHLLREYTLLLDPPVYTRDAAATTTSRGDERPFIDPADASKRQSVKSGVMDNASRPAVSKNDSAAMTHSVGVAAPAVASTTEADGSITFKPVSDEYRVKANDTLWSLANKMKPDASVSVEQMMLALVRKNPEAFINENTNGLKRGYILRMPERSAIAAVDRQQALLQVREHSALWRQYRESQMGVTPASSMAAVSGAESNAAADAPAADGQLSIVSVSEAEGSDATAAGQQSDELKRLKNELALARESLESERLEKSELNERLSSLEQRVQNVLQMDEADLAKLQQDLQGVRQEVEPPVVEVAPAEVVEEPVAEMAADETAAEEITADKAIDEVTDAAVIDGEEKAVDENLFVDETVKADDEPVVDQQETMAPVDQLEVPAFVQPKVAKTFVEKLLDDPSMLAAIGGGLLGVFVLIGVLLRRRRVSKEEHEWVDDELGGLDDIADDIDSAATIKTDAVDLEATGEMPAHEFSMGFDDTHIEAPDENLVFSLEDERSLESQEDVQDDVLAEADVYLAYGIYQQAEELLTNAINDNPERDDYRMKLLETYFAGKNSSAFAELAADAQLRKSDDKRYWDRVVAMGRDLCPENDLFTGGGLITDIDADDLLPEKPQTTDLELDAGDSDSAADLDLSMDDELADLELDSDATQILAAPADPGIDFPDDLDSGINADDLLSDTELEFNLGDFGEEDTNEVADSVVQATDEMILDDIDDSVLELPETDLGESLDLAADLEASLDASTDASGDIDEDFSLDFEASDLGFDDEDDLDTAENVSIDAELDLDADIELLDELDTEIKFDAADVADDLNIDMGMDFDAAEAPLSGEDDFDISVLSEEIDEVSTKLDLAKAYIDMGDGEGARSILEEVVQEGNDEQKQQAQELLAQAS